MSNTGKRIAIAGGVAVVLIAVAAGVVLGQLGRIIERGVETHGPRLTGTEVSLGSASVSLFSGEGALRRLHIGNPEGFTTDEAFDLGRIEIVVDPGSVAGDVVHIRSLVIDSPKLVAEFDATGRSNLNTILNKVRSAARGGGKAGKDGDGGKETRLIIDEFRFVNAEVRAYAPEFDLDKTLKLRAVELKNLGAKQGGAAASEIASQVLRPVVEAAMQAATGEYLARQRAKLGEKAEEKLMEKLFK